MGSTLLWVLVLGVLDAIAVFIIMRQGLKHGEHTPEKPEESHAVVQIRALNAARLAKVEAGRAKALPSGEAASS